MDYFIRADKAKVILEKLSKNFPKVKTHFSGSTPPEIFVGRVNYPNVFSGILAPDLRGDTTIMSSPEEWVKQNLSIEDVLAYRGQMIYARQTSNVKSQKSLHNVSQELALSSKPVSTEFFLKRLPTLNFTTSRVLSIMANPAPIDRVILEENPKVDKKVDYIVSDYDLKATNALGELYDGKIQVSHMQKLLSAGLLGVKMQRKMVPTKWSITAVDDILSKAMLREIKNYPELEEFLIFDDEYNGNHYQILFLPGEFNFEVMEVEIPTTLDQPNKKLGFWRDYEGLFGRKTYASSVTGAYYANRLAVCEFLKKIKKQAKAVIFREISSEYYAPLGVGILRELMRRALEKPQIKVESVQEALKNLNSRSKIGIEKFSELSIILNNYGKQKKLREFFSV